MTLIEEMVSAANADRCEPPAVEFIGEYRPEFAAMMQRNLSHPTNDNEGRRYRLVKMVFEEIP